MSFDKILDLTAGVYFNFIMYKVAPVTYQVILETSIGQFREFESPRVCTRIISWRHFLVHNLTCGERESSVSNTHSMEIDEQ